MIAPAIAAGKIEHGDFVDFKEPWSAWHEIMAVGKWFVWALSAPRKIVIPAKAGISLFLKEMRSQLSLG